MFLSVDSDYSRSEAEGPDQRCADPEISDPRIVRVRQIPSVSALIFKRASADRPQIRSQYSMSTNFGYIGPKSVQAIN